MLIEPANLRVGDRIELLGRGQAEETRQPLPIHRRDREFTRKRHGQDLQRPIHGLKLRQSSTASLRLSGGVGGATEQALERMNPLIEWPAVSRISLTSCFTFSLFPRKSVLTGSMLPLMKIL